MINLNNFTTELHGVTRRENMIIYLNLKIVLFLKL